MEKSIEEVMKESYLTYAMSVIVSRALPDVRDGLKPVHRRILYAMYELGNFSNKPYKKSARIVGEVLGKYHPHGDAAIYDTLVRMAQDFSMRYPLVDGQGNFGSIDGDSAAAMRYTEVRMAKIAEEMLADIDKDTVDFVPNFDNTLKEPVVLPSKIPQLLINGSSGIAVGMATNIPPHNLGEIVDALVAIIEGREEEVLSIVKGPDFPTGGIVLGKGGIMKAYKEGRGIIRVRAKTEIKGNKIYITEIPYQITKAKIIEDIVNVVKDKRIEGIADLHDRSDKRGLLIEITLRKNANAEVVLNKLFEYTSLEVSYGIINIALVNGVPKYLSLMDMLKEFLSFRFETIRRRTAYLKRKAEERLHVVEGLIKALHRIDETVETIKKAKDYEEAKNGLQSLLGIDETQAKAVLDMRMQRLIALEREKLEKESNELRAKIEYYAKILNEKEEVYKIIKEELLDIKKKYGDERRTEIWESYEERDIEDLIADEEVVVAYKDGYIKRVSIDELRTQRRGGKGLSLDADIVVSAKNHDTLLIFTDKGRVYGLKVYQIPKMNRYAKGKPIKALVSMESENVVELLSTRKFDGYLMFATKRGIVKRTRLNAYEKIRKNGITAVLLREGDAIVDVKKVNDGERFALITRKGVGLSFDVNEVREMGRVSHGVIGIRVEEGDEVVSSAVARKGFILIITSKGYGKLLAKDELRSQHRGGKGMILIKLKEHEGVVKMLSIDREEEVVIITKNGKSIRISTKNVPVLSRYARGVKLVKVEEGDEVRDATVVYNEGSEAKNL